ncbi:MAG: MarR family transcriptional regulator [Methanoregula sp.]|jgi:DNA-binding MarR family transcriptional regulator|uniref:MarR family winged helix-turn-helix transcriptional regulator n=1 Tax=Methanoregula sp. TaxID=2052170 RepID=UPI003C1DE853
MKQKRVVVTDIIKERIAENLIALLPFYHKKIFQPGLGKTGMQVAQYRTLGILMREGTPLPMSELGKRLYISKPYMTMLVNQLIQDGLAQRIPDTHDRRVINITITPEGSRHLKKSASLYKENIKNILSGLDRQDLEDLCQSLEKLRSIISRID